MGDLPYISSEQGGLIIHTELNYIRIYTIYKRPILIQAEEGGGLIIHICMYGT